MSDDTKGEIKIEKGVPLKPIVRTKDAFPFEGMDHEDSFFVAGEGKALQVRIWNRFSYWKRATGAKGSIRVRKVDGGYRVWRVLQ